jgi:hypothetical protein
MFEYQVLVYQESTISAFLAGGGKVDPERFGAFLNTHARRGWRVVTIERENRRTFLFLQREAFVVVMERMAGEKPAAVAAPGAPAIGPGPRRPLSAAS